MRRHTFYLLTLVFLGLLLNSPASAQWPDDPATNLPIAVRAGEQVLPIPAVTSAGGCYIGWFDQSSGNYDVYLQRLDRYGTPQWQPNGILISGHPQSSSLVTWDLMADSHDNAVLVFSDTRAGNDLDIYAYKVSPAGDMLWGGDGVTLSTNGDYEPGAAVTEADDGDFVFVWAWLPSGDGAIRMQRLSPEGVERFAHGGLAVGTETGRDPAFPDVVPSAEGSVIVSWVRDISLYMSPRHIHAERFSARGRSLWGSHVAVYDASSVQAGYHPTIQSDGQGGALCAWYGYESTSHQSRLQHLDANGVELFGHNGVKASTLTSQNHIDPTLAYDPTTGDSYVFWNERNAGQTQWGIYAQRITPDGTRQWGANGLVLLPVNTIYKSYPRAVSCDGGAVVFLTEEPTGMYNQEHLIGMRVDAAGSQTWPTSPIEVSSLLSGKARYPVVVGDEDMAILVWEDNRNGNVDLYGQNVNADGTLGLSPGAVDPPIPAFFEARISNLPNPFAETTQFTISVTGRMQDPRLQIFDLSGRTVNTARLDDEAVGPQTYVWNGHDEDGEILPGGVYFYRIVHRDGVSAVRRAILTR